MTRTSSNAGFPLPPPQPQLPPPQPPRSLAPLHKEMNWNSIDSTYGMAGCWRKVLLLSPIHVLETLRGDHVHQSNVKLNKGDIVKVKGITGAQADVDVTFTFSSLDEAESFDLEWSKLPKENLALEICALKGTKQGGLGPFRLPMVASEKLVEYTHVFFTVFKNVDNKHKVLMCSDAST
ncbi:glycoside hydrolase, family 32 [Tanacetum coccineum]